LSTISQLSDALHRCFDRSPRGVVGLADDLLRLCAEQGLELDWQGESCRARSSADGWEETLREPIPKPVFRALLARLASLPNEAHQGTVSPYGGQFEWDAGDGRRVRIVLANTPDEQTLKVTPATP
jgi:hypothetical protein